MRKPEGLVALARQVGHALGLDQLSDQTGELKVVTSAVEGGDLAEVVVAAQAVGQVSGGSQAGLAPQRFAFQAVEEPAAQGLLFEFLPRLSRPAAFEFGPLDHADGLVLGDGLEPALDQEAVILWPVARNLGDRGGAVAIEPRGFDLTCSHPGEADLKGALTEIDGWWVFAACGEIVLEQAIESVTAPVKFLLEGDHLAPDGFMLFVRRVEGLAARYLPCAYLYRSAGKETLTELVEPLCRVSWAAFWEWELLELCAIVLIEPLPCLRRDSASYTSTSTLEKSASSPELVGTFRFR